MRRKVTSVLNFRNKRDGTPERKLNFASCGKTEAFINAETGISTNVVFGMIRVVSIAY
jgi:hypothetical protein